VVPVKDINPSPKIQFKHVNIYDKAQAKKDTKEDVFIRRYYLIPISNKKEGKNWIIYELG